MTLRKKTLLIIGLTLVSLIVAMYVASSTILLDGFARVEKQAAQDNAERALAALSDEIANLSRITRDYASWDDTYAFIEDANEDYPKVNLVDTTFVNLKLNLMVFIHSSGRVVFSEAFDLQNESQVPFPESLLKHLSTDAPLLQHSGPDSDLTGLVLLPEGTLLVSSRPILSSEYQGPIRGTLIFGRYLDSAEIERLSETTNLLLTVHRFDTLQMDPDVRSARASLSDQAPILIRPLSAQTIAGYALLTDVDGQPALVLRVEQPRAIYQQGQTSVRFLILWFLAAGLILGLVALVLFEKSFTSRLGRLSATVNSINASGDLSARVPMDGKDELSSIASAFNALVSQLQRTHQDLEGRVTERTAELTQASERLRRQANQLQASSEIAHVATSHLDPDQLISQVVGLIRERFGFYYVGLFLTDADNRFAALASGTGEAGRLMKERGHRLEVGGQSVVGWVCANRQSRIALDVGQDAVRFANPLLPDTRSEMALPLRTGERVIGALDVQSVQEAAFDESDIAVLQGMADQVAVALENARLLQQSQSALQELDATNRLLTLEGWQGFLEQAQARRRAEFRRAKVSEVEPPSEPLVVPLELRGQLLGRLTLQREDDRAWSDEEIEMIQAIALQTALSADNARLIEQTRQALGEARALYETSREITSAGEMSEVLAAVLDDLARTGVHAAAIALFDTPTREQAKYIELAGAWDYAGPPRLAPGARFAIADFPLFDRITDEGTLVSADLLTDPGIDDMAKTVLGGLGLRGMAITPLVARDQWIGLLFALTEQPHTFTWAELNFHHALADQAAVAIDNRRLLAETQQRAHREALIRQITTRIRAASDVQGVLEATAAELARSLGTSRAIVRLTVGEDERTQ